ncbi:ATP-dependent DNA helicase RecG [Allofranklinella schreckenbergeri]|uniref:ATP-dependent DNA helicase RecG n=1 Tax=Allofranklinella schreckenbergeri TaxID=1076744 RepID=A0A3M6R317_9BURK|nr:ATP-dependent DNA helicase RecG [Allofranklinella schreckenbergeri]RMX09369.1 ATP-dependent DNA helicase RecG [Allofranklinella schreckenbergeri]
MTPAIRKALDKLGLHRDIDLVLHLPLRYEDETRIVPIAQAREGRSVLIEATVTHCEVQLHPRRQLVAVVEDASGSCQLRFLHFYPSQQKSLAPGKRLRLYGEMRGGFWGREMVHPQLRKADAPLPAALTPVYPVSKGLPQAYLRRMIVMALQRIALPDTLPAALFERIGPPPLPKGAPRAEAQSGAASPWWPLAQTLRFLHHPAPDVPLHTLQDHSHPAWQRLKVEELLAQQLSQYRVRQLRQRLRAPVLRAGQVAGHDAGSALPLHEQLLARIPFALTRAQRRVVGEILADIARPIPMHRLLQGDVGSGKTIVAALAACACIDAGWQCALMAPTEILAEQHLRKLSDWLDPLLQARGQHVAWLAGAQKKKQRQATLDAIASGQAALVVGTHAVIQEQVRFARLGLALIDEQHRFGVEQRLSLRNRQGDGAAAAPAHLTQPAQPGEAASASAPEPHMLMMSATPIPRTLAMSYYADLDVSTIDELPPGRTPVDTRLIADARRDELIARLAHQIAQGRQAYWVCPLIEESEALDLSNATATYEELCAAMPQARIGLLHSRMPQAEKHHVMAQFAAGDMGLLVATTVIEVGVDVPNASLMVVEHAERFGLSQLHQLRGRVGRGTAQSACILLYTPGETGRLGDTAKERLRAMAQTNDGFEIARRDLEIRGPGEFLGARQSGAALLRFADLEADQPLLEWARTAAPIMLRDHPQQAEEHMRRWLGVRWEFLKA